MPDLDLLWRSYVRRFDLEHTFRFLKQGMGWTTPRGFATPSRRIGGAGSGSGRLHAAKVGARMCCGPEAALGETLRHRSTDTYSGPSGSFVAFGGAGHASEGAETLR
jgi:hypothetical protein